MATVIMFFRKSKASQETIEQDEETTHRAPRNKLRWRRAWLSEQEPWHAETRAYLRQIDDDEPHELWKITNGR